MMKRNKLELNPVGWFVCILFMLLISKLHAAETVMRQVNSIEHILVGKTGVEIHLHSSEEFPVRAIPPLLQVGSAVFNRSYRPASGDLHRLIFLVSPSAFATLRTGDPVQVMYGADASPQARWDFGTFSQ